MSERGRVTDADTITLADLEGDPHALLAALREREPVAWLPAIGGWLVSRRDLALHVLRNPDAFTVDDPRFSTGQVVGPSMLTLDGAAHGRHRAPFAAPFRLDAVRERFTGLVAAEAEALIDGFAADGHAELRRAFAGPLAAAVVGAALGLEEIATDEVLGWYDAIVDATTRVTAGCPVTPAGREAFAALGGALAPVLDRRAETSLLAAAAGAGGLRREEVVSNAGVLLFGGIETTEGMIANAVLHLLQNPDQLALVAADPALAPAAIEESLRLEPAAAVVDRYATADVAIGDARVDRGDLVRVSLAAANRDPATFSDPDRFDVLRTGAGRHLAFAAGPHVCVGMHLARLEAHVALTQLPARLPALRLDPAHPGAPRGLVFRKPPTLHVRWDPDAPA